MAAGASRRGATPRRLTDADLDALAGGTNAPENLFTALGFTYRGPVDGHDLPATEDVTISQAILRAGGFAQFADKKHVRIVRSTPSQGEKTILVDVESIMVKGQMQKDIYIRKNDVLIIPEKTVNF